MKHFFISPHAHGNINHVDKRYTAREERKTDTDIHVIEFSEVEKLRLENKRLREMLLKPMQWFADNDYTTPYGTAKELVAKIKEATK